MFVHKVLQINFYVKSAKPHDPDLQPYPLVYVCIYKYKKILQAIEII